MKIIVGEKSTGIIDQSDYVSDYSNEMYIKFTIDFYINFQLCANWDDFQWKNYFENRWRTKAINKK